MNRIITLAILSIVAPFTAVLAFIVYVILDTIHAFKRRQPVAPITRSQRRSFEEEGAEIQRRLIAQGEAKKARRVDPMLAS
jgi:hypothetical protein